MTYSPNNFGQPMQFSASQISIVPNATGTTIAKARPVRITATGMNTLSISSSAQVEALIGLTLTNVLTANNGQVVMSGVIPTISALYPGFVSGDGVWIDSTGAGLTNVPPSLGAAGFVAGMYVIKVGTIRKNLAVPANLDLMVEIQNRGQL